MFDRTLQPPSERETPVCMTKALHRTQLALSVAIRRRFNAMHTSFHSALTRCKPRRLNCRKPNTCLIQPLGGSAIHFRRRYASLAASLYSLSAICAVNGLRCGSNRTSFLPSRPSETITSVPQLASCSKTCSPR